MSKHAIGASALAALLLLVTAVPNACAHDVQPSAGRRTSLAPADPPVTPYSAGDGTYRVTWDMKYLQTLTGRLEVRHRQFFIDDNLKGDWQRNSIVWSVKWRF